MSQKSKEMQQSKVDWLLEEKNPSVRYFTLTRFLGKQQDSPEVKKAKKQIMSVGVVPRYWPSSMRTDIGPRKRNFIATSTKVLSGSLLFLRS